MPRLLVFNRSYHPDIAATGQLLTQLCEDLAAQFGWQVTVVAGRPTVTACGEALSPVWRPLTRERINGVSVLRGNGTALDKARAWGRVTNYLSYFGVATLAPVLATRPDVVMSLTDPPVLGLAGLAWARRWRVPFVFLCQDIFPEVARLLDGFHSPLLERVLAGVNRLLVQSASVVVAIGETMKERLVRLRGADPARVVVIHNWGDRTALQGGARNGPFAQAHHLVDRFVVMHSGNLGLSQGLETLVDAAALLTVACPQLRVVIVGDGVRRASLEARARVRGAHNVTFLSYQPRERLRDSFAAADVFVISLLAGLAGFIVPSKLYGIVCAGKPFVAAVDADSEVARVAEAHGCGVIVPPGDVRALADALRSLYERPARLAELSAAACRVAPRFDREGAVRAYHDVLTALVQDGHRSRMRQGFPGPQPP